MASQEENKTPIIVSGWDNHEEENQQRVESTANDVPPNVQPQDIPINELIARLAETVSAQQFQIKQLQETIEAMKKEIELLKAAGGRSRAGSLDDHDFDNPANFGFDEYHYFSDDSEDDSEKEFQKELSSMDDELDNDEEDTRFDDDEEDTRMDEY
ncbi:hypothetical protein ACHAPJ_012783 [Fusarium lateritium]